MSKFALLLLIFTASTLAIRSLDVQTRAGKPIPLHIPTQTLAVNETFEVPAWLGAYYATVDVQSTWTLPPTIGNGGQTYPGEFLFVRNYGPASITLYATQPETIEGAASYPVPAGSIVEILSGYPNWVVVTPSSNSNIVANSGTFNTLQTQNETVDCDLIVGTGYNQTGLDNLLRCGDTVTKRIFIGQRVFDGSNRDSTRDYILIAQAPYNVIDSTVKVSRGWFPAFFVSGGATNAVLNLASETQSIHGTTSGDSISNTAVYGGSGPILYGPLSITGTSSYVTGMITLGANWTGTVQNVRVGNPTVSVQAGASGTLVNVEPYYAPAVSLTSGVNVTNYRPHRCIGGTGGQTINSCFESGEMTGGTANSIIRFNTNAATCGAGILAGTSGDVCFYRGAASVWFIQNAAATGASLWVSKYSCVGCTSAPANTNTGAFSTTVSNPTLQAFGAITANAASGMLAFTVDTPAATCTTAVVTNTNVVPGSSVQLTIQSYTGTEFTNGLPVVSRSNNAGSSTASFAIKLCNYHATNALAGNLYVSFWVLN